MMNIPYPSEPPRTGVNLVPDGYVGPIRITTPTGRVKIRFVNPDGIVFRDSHYWAGGRFHIERHAVACRVEPCTVVVPQPASAGISRSPRHLDSLLAMSITLAGPEGWDR